MTTRQPPPSLGLSLAYFHRFIEVHGGRKVFDGLATMDVCNRFVKPTTLDSKLSLAEFVRRQPGGATYAKPADWLISHSWSYKFLDVVDAIDNFCQDQDLPHDTSFWFCLFANNQHEIGDPAEMFKKWLSAFRTALTDTKQLVMVLSPWHNPESLQRSWCVYEVYLSIVLNARFEVALGNHQKVNFLVDIAELQSIDRMKARINSKNSIATVPSDRDHIFALIEKQVGFTQLDRMVFDVIQTWVLRALDKQVAVAALPADRFQWLYTRSRMLLDDAQFEKAAAGFQSAVDIFERDLPKDSCVEGWQAKVYIGISKANQFRGRDVWEPLFNEAFPKLEQLLGRTNPTTLTMKRRIAGAYLTVHDADRCIGMLQEILDIQAHLPKDTEHFKTVLVMGKVLRHRSDNEAEAWLVRAYTGLSQTLGALNRDTIECQTSLAGVYFSTGRNQQARALYASIYNENLRKYGPNHIQTTIALRNMARNANHLGDFDKAEKQLKSTVDSFRSLSSPMMAVWSQCLLGTLYLTKGDLVQAKPYLEQLYTVCEASYPRFCDGVLHHLHLVNVELYDAYDSVEMVDELVEKFQALGVVSETWKFLVCHACCKSIQGNVAYCAACVRYTIQFCRTCLATADFKPVCGHHQGPWTIVKPPPRELFERKLALLARDERWAEYTSAATAYVAYCNRYQVADCMIVNLDQDEKHSTSKSIRWITAIGIFLALGLVSVATFAGPQSKE